MAGIVRGWRVELVEAYPDLFRPAGDPPAALGWPCVGDGWCDLIEGACARIRTAVHADSGTFYPTQIKEKYGTLRFYWEGAMVEGRRPGRESNRPGGGALGLPCEICGAEGGLRGPGWLTTRCAAHAEGREPVEIKPYLQNVRIEERIIGNPRGVLPALRPGDRQLHRRRPPHSRNGGGVRWLPS